MQPDTTIFEGQETLARWIRTLVRQLRSGGKDAPPDLLPVAPMLEELRLTADAVMRGRTVPKADRVSLQEDLRTALEQLGPAQKREVVPYTQAFLRDDLSHLPEFLGDVEGARRLSLAATELLEQVTRGGVASAGWDDVVSAFEENAEGETCELRVAQLRSVVERRGHDWEERERFLSGLLRDDLSAAVRAGAIPAPDADDIDLNAPAGLSIEERFEQCRRAVAETAREAEVFVWFAFDQARIDDYLRVGPVQFFTSRLPLHAIHEPPLTDTHLFERPDELDDQFAELYLKGAPEEEGVLARVVLPAGPIARSRQRAEHLLLGLVQSALPDSGWRLLRGSAAYSADTGWWGTLGFRAPDRWDGSRVSPEFDPTPDFLKRLDSRYVDALTHGKDSAEDALSEVRWNIAAEDSERPQRTALRVRILERALPTPEGLRLADVIGRHLKESWSQTSLDRQIVDVAFAIPSAEGISPEADERLRELHGSAVSFGRREIQTSLADVVACAAEVAQLIPKETMQGRMAAELAQDVSSGEATLKRLGRFDAMFDRLVRRSVRQRNAIIHGSATVAEVVATADRFVEQLTDSVTATGIVAAAKGTSVAHELEEARTTRLEILHRLTGGTPLAEILDERGTQSTREESET